MMFYLDDYNLINTDSKDSLLYKDIKVFFNGVEVPFEIEEQFSIKTQRDYQDLDEIVVKIDEIDYPVVHRFIVQTKRFEEEYKVNLDRLGAYVIGDRTIFDLWSPLAKKAYVVIDKEEKQMRYLGKGLFELIVDKNLELSLYHYKTIRDRIQEFRDPFSFVDEGNDSYVLNTSRIKKEIIKVNKEKPTSIYEINVRDFSSGDNLPFKYPKKLLALTEEGLRLDGKPIGLDYLTHLGISHVQLMPIFSFDLDGGEYNWGYNPLAYNTLEKSYLVSNHPYEEINEFRYVVNKLHENGIKVNLDVVYNHTYKSYRFALNSMLPYYFFRYKDGKLADGSFCGNETRNESYFFKEYLKILVRRFIELYDIDGLRFDLMGLIDKQTILEIKEDATSLKEGFMVYGEGWKMSEVLKEENMSIIENGDKMKEVAFFNGHFRDILRGHNIDDRNAYLFGDISLKEEVRKLISATSIDSLDVLQNINYVECHDNFTMYDKCLKIFNDERLAKKVCKLALSLVVLSKGIPFIHSGQEFLRTKQDNDNTYNMPDCINGLDWYLKNENEDVADYLTKLLKIKEKLNSYDCDDETIHFDDYYEVLICRYKGLSIFINSCIYDHIYSSEDEYHLLLNENGFLNEDRKDFEVPCFSVVIGIKM